MAIDAYMQFTPYTGAALDSESQVDFSTISKDPLGKNLAQGKLFEVSGYNFSISQVLSIGSQATGAGAGKVSFEPFVINRRIDKASPVLFQMACSGTPFKFVTLVLRKAGGGTQAGSIFLRFDFKLVAIANISYGYDDEAPLETVSFEYGGITYQYSAQKPDGTMDKIIPGGWNKVKNISDTDPNAVIN